MVDLGSPQHPAGSFFRLRHSAAWRRQPWSTQKEPPVRLIARPFGLRSYYPAGGSFQCKQTMKGSSMSTDTTTAAPVLKIVAATFGSEEAAAAAKARLIADEDAVGNIAIVTMDSEGKVKFKETGDMGPGKGALVGGGVGLVLALFTGPGAILAGAGVGALAAKLRDSGFDDSQLRGLGEDLTPGTAAIVSIVPESALTAVESDLRGSDATRLVVKEVGFDLANMLDEEASAAGITPEAATEGIAAPSTRTTV
jgi:uncharacterized membrane protein